MSFILRALSRLCGFAAFIVAGVTGAACGQSQDLPLHEFRPQPMLRVPQTDLERASFPAVDVHTHFFFKTRHSESVLEDFVQLMDRNNIAICVSMDGGLGDRFAAHRDYLWDKYRDRFVIFSHIDWQGDGADDKPGTWACNQPGFADRTARQIRAAAEAGISGLKVFKSFGLRYRDAQGNLIEIDDPRFDPIWQVCGELGLPVLIHTADPAAFFLPVDERNERYEELQRHPDWSFYGDEFPSREELLAARNRVIARHPKTPFIGAHVANSSEDLRTVAEWLDKYPNLHTEFASRISELGRQPYTARDFLIEYADRIMFGTDGPWPEERIHYYWRFLETRDQYFPYAESEFPPQGLWRIYGVDLPEPVLRKIYHENAARLIPGVAERLAKFRRE